MLRDAVLVAILSGFAVSLFAPWIFTAWPRAGRCLVALLPLTLFIYFIGFIEPVAAGKVFITSHEWAPSLGVNVSFRIDGLSLLFALLISGIGALVIVYANSYLAGHLHLGRFYAYILIFMASMLGLVLADNVIAVYVFWELTSISSYFLIGFDHRRESARAAALQALLVTGAGGLALLAGLVLLGQTAGTMEISTMLQNAESIRNGSLYAPILLLVLAGALTKSAQVPFHFWLPSAMEAPTPVSAYLHSATMVKAGVYLLARLNPVLGGTVLWFNLLGFIGAVTMLMGAYLALRQTDLKLLLAYLTVSALGLLTLFVGLGTSAGFAAAIVFLLAHALYKGGLFLVAGIIDHETGTRDVNHLGGLGSVMPLTAAAAALAALSLAALPPSFGFIGKEMLLEAGLGADQGAPVTMIILTTAVVLASTVFVAAALIVAFQPFFGNKTAASERAHEASPSFWLPPVLLATLGILFGVIPWAVGDRVLRPAVEAIAGAPVTLDLALWHGLNLPLMLSALSLVGGVVVYAALTPILRGVARLEITSRWGPQNWWNLLLAGLNALARGQTILLQSGYLRYYLLIIIVTIVALGGSRLFGGLPSASIALNFDASFYEWVLGGLIVLGALAAVLSTSRLAAVAALGVVGYGVALIFVLFGAPDLAMTQFMVETLTVILFVLAFYHLPRFAIFRDAFAITRDAIVTLALGALITTVVLIGSGIQLYPKISEYFIQNSMPDAHGQNVVNVILVDFRGFDTLGEITVLAVAGIGVYALLKLKLGRKSDG